MIKTQCVGLALAAMTAIGCVAYERICKALPFRNVCFFVWVAYFWIWAAMAGSSESALPSKDYVKGSPWVIVIFLLSGLTVPCWYWLTRRYSVLVGGTFEIKYIIILALTALAVGEQKPSFNTLIGAVLAILSIYFISK